MSLSPTEIHEIMGRPVNARVGAHDTTIEAEGMAALRVDRAGRWGSMRWGRAFWRRTVGSGVAACHADGVRDLEATEAATVHEQVRALASALRQAVSTGASSLRLLGVTPHRGALVERLEAVAPWTPARHAHEAALFRAAYPEGVPILPPDRSQDLVVLATRGCPWGRCDFCAFYRDRPFHILDRREFDAHLSALEELLGDALALRRGLFLGSANALALPQARIVPLLEQAARRFGANTRGVAAFWDPDHAPARSAGEWEALAAGGLRRVVVGLETGDGSLRRTLGKRGDIGRIIRLVREQKAGGVRSGLVVLAGPGGLEAAPRHREATAAALEAMGLSRDDLVYVSPLERDMPPEALLEETRRLRAHLEERLEARVVPYRMDMFRYYA